MYECSYFETTRTVHLYVAALEDRPLPVVDSFNYSIAVLHFVSLTLFCFLFEAVNQCELNAAANAVRH